MEENFLETRNLLRDINSLDDLWHCDLRPFIIFWYIILYRLLYNMCCKFYANNEDCGWSGGAIMVAQTSSAGASYLFGSE